MPAHGAQQRRTAGAGRQVDAPVHGEQLEEIAMREIALKRDALILEEREKEQAAKLQEPAVALPAAE